LAGDGRSEHKARILWAVASSSRDQRPVQLGGRFSAKFLTLIGAVLGGVRAAHIEPSDGLREV
jgi:outer membrane lipoprotein SlyB